MEEVTGPSNALQPPMTREQIQEQEAIQAWVDSRSSGPLEAGRTSRDAANNAPQGEGSDRDLLEKAADAAGLRHYGRFDFQFGLEVHRFEHNAPRWWNPLEDDGDALRLACALSLDVYPVARTMAGQACSAVGSVGRGRLAEVVGETQAATRRAIVRAAAALAQP